MAFPATRMRRLRATGALRGLIRETELTPSHLVYPMFVELGTESRNPIESMPGVDRMSINTAVEEAGEAFELGVPAVMIFGVPAVKDEFGSGAYDEEGVAQRADRAIDNDVTIELLAKTAISHAAAGADAVAPSDMMDGRVGALRGQLDQEDHKDVPIVAYSAKFASAFYGPFREAADATPAFGDRRSY